MELRTLRYFLAAASEENITRAADILHVTQPTLSRQLMDLERELGTTLMYRGKKGMTLTEDGLFFRQRAEEIVELADRLEQSFVERSTEVSGVISIGATESVGSRLFAKLIKQFSDKYPLVKFDLYNEMADYIKERMDKGLIDVGLLLEPVDTSKYDFVRLSQKETWGVLMRADHPLSDRETLRAEEMRPYPLILPLRERVRAEILNWLNAEEKDLNIPLSYTLLSNAVLLVEEGLGCAFCLDGAHPQQSGPALYPHRAGAHHPQRAGVEEEPPVHPGGVPVHSGDQHASGQDDLGISGTPSPFGLGVPFWKNPCVSRMVQDKR